MTDLHPDMNRVLLSSEEIGNRVKELSDQISEDMKGIDRLYIIGILKGAFIFLADLTRQLKVPHLVDFMAVSSYGKTVDSGAVRIVMDLREPIEGQHVLIVEDILDSGRTLSYLYHTLQGRNPASLRTCVLLRKIKPDVNVPVDYLGFDIGDFWVVGYGLDFADKYRTLPYIAELKQEATQSGK
jgi:hypoxanthine phosphoribosyltransferase